MGHSLILSPHSWHVPWPHRKIMFFRRSKHTGHMVCSLISCNCCCSFCTSALTLVLSLSFCKTGMFPLAFPPQHIMKGTLRSTTARHCTHFFIKLAQFSQAHIWPQGWKSTAAFLSEHTTHSSIFVLDWTCSLQMRHFFTRGEHKEHVAMWPHGPNRVSLFMSEHTIHSSKVSESLLIIDGLREPTWPLQRNLAVKLLRIKKPHQFKMHISWLLIFSYALGHQCTIIKQSEVPFPWSAVDTRVQGHTLGSGIVQKQDT